MPRPVPGNSAPSLPILPRAPLPTEQLTQIQRRLAHLLNSLAELQSHVANAHTLEEWPSLLSRHLALASQTSSLTSFLSYANPNTLNAQLAHFNESLTNEALHDNKFSAASSSSSAAAQDGKGVAFGSDDVLFSGSKGQDDNQQLDGSGAGGSNEGRSLINVQYTDEKNPLRHTAPHPLFPLEAERSQMVLPSLVLPKPDDGVLHEQEERWQSYAKENKINPEAATIKTELSTLETIREQIRRHDQVTGQAIRSFIHAKEATDEMGQRYDWKIRLNPDELSEDEEEEEEEKDEAMDDEEGGHNDDEAKGKTERKGAEATLSLEQVSRLLSTGQM